MVIYKVKRLDWGKKKTTGLNILSKKICRKEFKDFIFLSCIRQITNMVQCMDVMCTKCEYIVLYSRIYCVNQSHVAA